MLIVNTSDEKLKTLLESATVFDSPEHLKTYLLNSGEKDFKLQESQDNQVVTILRILKG